MQTTDQNPTKRSHSDSRKEIDPAAGAPSANLFVKRKISGDQARESIQRPSITFWKDAWLRLQKNKIALTAGAYIIFLSLASLILPTVLHYSYEEQEVWNKHMPPSLGESAIVIDSNSSSYVPVKAAPSETIATPSSTAAVTTDPPAAPAKVEALGEPLSSGVAIKWTQVDGAEGYRVYRSIAKDTLGVPLYDGRADGLSYLDRSGLNSGETYFYAVTAFNAFGDSLPSPLLEVVPKLALSLTDALKIDGNATVGSVIQTNPHYLGTDYLGRDMFARVMSGARISLFIGFAAPTLYVLLGIIYGCISGYFGGLVDNIMMRIADLITTVPELLIVIMLQVVLGSGPTTLIIALVMGAWPGIGQQIRGEVLRIREMEFVHAAEVLGTPFRKVIFRHMLPNVMGTVLVLFSIAIPRAIFAEAFLSFIGLGIAPPTPSLGSVTREGAKVFLAYPHELVIPALLLSLTVLAFNLLGDGLRDALDPKLRGAK